MWKTKFKREARATVVGIRSLLRLVFLLSRQPRHCRTCIRSYGLPVSLRLYWRPSHYRNSGLKCASPHNFAPDRCFSYIISVFNLTRFLVISSSLIYVMSILFLRRICNIFLIPPSPTSVATANLLHI